MQEYFASRALVQRALAAAVDAPLHRVLLLFPFFGVARDDEVVPHRDV